MRVLIGSGLVRHEDTSAYNFRRVLAPNDIRLNTFLIGKCAANVRGKQAVELVQDTGDAVNDGIHAADDMILKNGLDVHNNPFSCGGHILGIIANEWLRYHHKVSCLLALWF